MLNNFSPAESQRLGVQDHELWFQRDYNNVMLRTTSLLSVDSISGFQRGRRELCHDTGVEEEEFGF